MDLFPKHLSVAGLVTSNVTPDECVMRLASCTQRLSFCPPSLYYSELLGKPELANTSANSVLENVATAECSTGPLQRLENTDGHESGISSLYLQSLTSRHRIASLHHDCSRLRRSYPRHRMRSVFHYGEPNGCAGVSHGRRSGGKCIILKQENF